MDDLALMENRHAVRSYLEKPIEEEKRTVLKDLVAKTNQESGLSSQLIFDEPKAFDTFLAHYGKFSHVTNYLALVGKKGGDEACGYTGEQFVLKAQELGLNSCWVALTFGKRKVPVELAKGQVLFCVIAFGYGATQGVSHATKKPEDVLTVTGEKPAYLDLGVKAALLAPAAMNQQKFMITVTDGTPSIQVHGSGFYTAIDLGIVKYHFEAATGVKLS